MDMNICEEFRDKVIDFVENQLSEQECRKYYEHMQHCRQCQREYTAGKRLFEMLDADEVVLPEEIFFDELRQRVRKEKLRLRPFSLKNIIRVLIPVCAAAAILLILNRPSTTVEITVPTSALLKDEDVASLTLARVIDEELINEMSAVENYWSLDIDETIEGMTEEERTELIENLHEKYGNGI
jgi:hypothetical protein